MKPVPGLERTDSQFELAEARYEAVGRWIAGAEERLIRTVLIYHQDSAAIQTTVKPIGRIKHDVELISRVVEPHQLVSAAAFKFATRPTSYRGSRLCCILEKPALATSR